MVAQLEVIFFRRQARRGDQQRAHTDHLGLADKTAAGLRQAIRHLDDRAVDEIIARANSAQLRERAFGHHPVDKIRDRGANQFGAPGGDAGLLGLTAPTLNAVCTASADHLEGRSRPSYPPTNREQP